MEISERVIKTIADELGLDLDQVKPESNLQEDLGADSLDLIEVCMAIEEEFDTEILDEEFDNFTTVQDVINFIGQQS